METPPAARVLVVEGDGEMRRVISAALTREGYAVVEAVDENSALAACGRVNPDVIVVDLGLASLAAFARDYRKIPGSSGRIIVISGTDRSAESAARARASTYFSKPFVLWDLISEVCRLAELPPQISVQPPPIGIPWRNHGARASARRDKDRRARTAHSAK